MLDLKELEKKVDEIIAKDTPEEMMEWLLKKRMKEFSYFIPEGIAILILMIAKPRRCPEAASGASEVN